MVVSVHDQRELARMIPEDPRTTAPGQDEIERDGRHRHVVAELTCVARELGETDVAVRPEARVGVVDDEACVDRPGRIAGAAAQPLQEMHERKQRPEAPRRQMVTEIFALGQLRRYGGCELAATRRRTAHPDRVPLHGGQDIRVALHPHSSRCRRLALHQPLGPEGAVELVRTRHLDGEGGTYASLVGLLQHQARYPQAPGHRVPWEADRSIDIAQVVITSRDERNRVCLSERAPQLAVAPECGDGNHRDPVQPHVWQLVLAVVWGPGHVDFRISW